MSIFNFHASAMCKSAGFQDTIESFSCRLERSEDHCKVHDGEACGWGLKQYIARNCTDGVDRICSFDCYKHCGAVDPDGCCE